MDKKKLYRSLFFLAIGIILFWFVFKGTDLSDLRKELTNITWFWIGISAVINILSQLVRAIRWKLLFVPLKYSPKLHNLFFSVLILGFTNQVIPRGGEIARLGVVNRYEKIHFAKLVGIALIERLTDLIILIMIFFSLLIWQFDRIKTIVSLPQISPPNLNMKNVLLIISIAIVVVSGAAFAIKKFHLLHKFKERIEIIKEEIKEGFTSIYHIKNKFLYFTLSFLIYALWFLMSYVLFFSYPPLSHLGFEAAAFTFGLATLAFLLPVQAGIGAWHFVVIQCLILFGIDQESGKMFSLLAHASTNLVYLPLGAIVFALLPLINKNKGH